MSTIKESIDTLSEKLGVTEREQTIKDQLDLCVERLGGEGNSKDIAESAEKFAEKEDGTATFMTKTITENDTYNAADDGVSGYSSVTVNVPSGSEAFEVIIEIDPNYDHITSISKTCSETLQKILNGDYVKIMLKYPNEEPFISGGYSPLFNSSTQEYDGILINRIAGYAEGMVTIQGYKWNFDDTYVNDVILVEEPNA